VPIITETTAASSTPAVTSAPPIIEVKPTSAVVRVAPGM
jgi:hypothetical protein